MPKQTIKIGNYSNVFFTYDTDKWTNEFDIQLHRIVSPLVRELSLRHPDWKILASDDQSGWAGHAPHQFSTDFVISYFRITKDEELIGTIDVDGYSERTYKMYIDNPRIRELRARGKGASTKDLKKAVKLVESNFTPRSLMEVIEEASKDVSSRVGHTATKKRYMVDDVMRRAMPGLRKYLRNNADAMMPTFIQEGVHPSAVESFPEVYDSFRAALLQAECVERDAGHIVIIRKGQYVVTTGKGTLVGTYDNSTLPEELKAKLGVLKIFEDTDEPVETIGQRISDNVFYLLP